jgi:hypothetical protein
MDAAINFFKSLIPGDYTKVEETASTSVVAIPSASTALTAAYTTVKTVNTGASLSDSASLLTKSSEGSGLKKSGDGAFAYVTFINKSLETLEVACSIVGRMDSVFLKDHFRPNGYASSSLSNAPVGGYFQIKVTILADSPTSYSKTIGTTVLISNESRYYQISYSKAGFCTHASKDKFPPPLS